MKKIAFIFPGQGSQAVGMGRAFVEKFGVAKEMVERASGRLGYDLSKLLFEPNDNLSQTKYTQPAILLVSLMAHKLFENELPIKPLYALGHSLGELSAVSAMGGLSLEDALLVAQSRGEWMQGACSGVDAGMMVTLGLSDEKAEELCLQAQKDGKKVYPANYNSDGQIVMAGIRSDLVSMEDEFKKAGAKRAMLLDMSVASHCPILQSAVDPLKNLLQEKLALDLIAPIVSNATNEIYSTKDRAVALLADQLIKPVFYKQAIRKIENEVDLFIEFGHGSVLKGLNKKITQKPTISVSTPDELEIAIDEVGK